MVWKRRPCCCFASWWLKLPNFQVSVVAETQTLSPHEADLVIQSQILVSGESETMLPRVTTPLHLLRVRERERCLLRQHEQTLAMLFSCLARGVHSQSVHNIGPQPCGSLRPLRHRGTSLVPTVMDLCVSLLLAKKRRGRGKAHTGWGCP